MTSPVTELDHIVIAAHTLAQGVSYVQSVLGVEMPRGGQHARMATHNCVLRLGPSIYLELIAIDPDAAPPTRPRWFQLDDPALAAELRTRPRLIHWLVRTQQIAEIVLASDLALGAIEPMRRGDMRWLITVASDGAMPGGGMLPSLIQWPDTPHPTSRMPDLGYALDRLEAVHPDPAGYRRDLTSLGAERHITVTEAPPATTPHLVAHIRTPHGVKTLR
jgi:hypothetical protein